MNTLNRKTLPWLACLVSLSIAPVASAKPKSVGYAVGNLAPELRMTRAQGGTLALSTLKGSYVVVDLSTMWCDSSEHAAAGVRDAVSRLNAAGAVPGGTPVVWVTAEFQGMYFSPPPSSTVARFAQKFGIGDPLSPVVSFGPSSSPTYQAAVDQIGQYTLVNVKDPEGNTPPIAFPTFLVIDPAGVIIDVFQGFYPYTLARIKADLNAKDVTYQLRSAAYAGLTNTLSALDVTTTIDGVASSARFALPGPTAQASGDSQFIVEAAFWDWADKTKAMTTTSTYVAISRDGDDLDLGSTYQLRLGAVVSPTAPFSSMSQVSGTWVAVIVHALGDPSLESWRKLPITLGADGQLPPFELDAMIEPFREEIELELGGPFGVSEIDAFSEWDGPVINGFGR